MLLVMQMFITIEDISEQHHFCAWHEKHEVHCLWLVYQRVTFIHTVVSALLEILVD